MARKFKILQVCMFTESETTHKLNCDIENSKERASSKARQILNEHYRNKIPYGWEDYKKRNNL